MTRISMRCALGVATASFVALLGCAKVADDAGGANTAGSGGKIGSGGGGASGGTTAAGGTTSATGGVGAFGNGATGGFGAMGGTGGTAGAAGGGNDYSAVGPECVDCIDTSCAKNFAACNIDPDCTAFWACAKDCADTACIQTCQLMHSEGSEWFTVCVVGACAMVKCTTECGWSSDPHGTGGFGGTAGDPGLGGSPGKGGASAGGAAGSSGASDSGGTSGSGGK
jgi:hypothetical protein